MPEAEAMKRYLITCRIPEDKILPECRSRNTLENFAFSGEIIRHTLRKNAWEGTSIYFLFSENMRVEITREEKIIQKMEIYGGPVEAVRKYKLGITEYAYKNPELFLGIEPEELGTEIPVKKLSENDRGALWSFFALHDEISLRNEGRLVLLD